MKLMMMMMMMMMMMTMKRPLKMCFFFLLMCLNSVFYATGKHQHGGILMERMVRSWKKFMTLWDDNLVGGFNPFQKYQSN